MVIVSDGVFVDAGCGVGVSLGPTVGIGRTEVDWSGVDPDERER